MALQVNSFFYFFLIQGLTTTILILTYKKKKLFEYIFNHKTVIIKSLLIISIGLIVFLFQSSVGESDYSNRMSVIFINFNDKIILIKYFFSNLLRSEVIILIAVSALLFFYLSKL